MFLVPSFSFSMFRFFYVFYNVEAYDCTTTIECYKISNNDNNNGRTRIMTSNFNKQEEYAKEWGHKPHHITLLVELSPYAYILQQLIFANHTNR
jgi:hypothetical protein